MVGTWSFEDGTNSLEVLPLELQARCSNKAHLIYSFRALHMSFSVAADHREDKGSYMYAYLYPELRNL